jgi:hypothetical protein
MEKMNMSTLKPMITPALFTFESPAPGVTLKKSTDERLCIFVMQDGKPETLDAWGDCTKAVLQSWSQGKRHLLLHDLRKSGLLALDAHMQAKFDELYKFRPELERSVAIVLPSDLITELVARLEVKLRALRSPLNYPVHWEVFTKPETALKWLVQTQGNHSN